MLFLVVITNIKNQKEHHKQKSFEEEYINFLTKFGVQYDGQYIFEFYDAKK